MRIPAVYFTRFSAQSMRHALFTIATSITSCCVTLRATGWLRPIDHSRLVCDILHKNERKIE